MIRSRCELTVVLVPVIRRSSDPKTPELVRAVGLRFRTIGWISIAVLVATGIANLFLRFPAAMLVQRELWQSDFGLLLTAKLVLVGLMRAFSVAHDLLGSRASAAALRDPRSPGARALRTTASRLGRVTGMLALAIVFLAILLVRGVG